MGDDVQQDMLIKKTHMRMVADIAQESPYAYSRHTPQPPTHLITHPPISPTKPTTARPGQRSTPSTPQEKTEDRNIQPNDATNAAPRRPLQKFLRVVRIPPPTGPPLQLTALSGPHAAGFVKIPPEAKTIMNAPCHATKPEKKEKRPLSQQCACMPCRGPDHVNHHERPWHEPNIGGGDPHTSQCACLPWTRSRMSPPYVNHRERPMGTPPT